jgi:excisionase family DNA binding protein
VKPTPPSIPTQPLYSIEQVAERLGLHVRTVRGYVRDARLKATRIGKQYRVTHADLEALIGTRLAQPAPAARTRHVDLSTIVDIDVVSPDAAMRITDGLIAAANMNARTGSERLRIDTAYDETRARLKLIITGDLAPVRAMIELVAQYLEAGK